MTENHGAPLRADRRAKIRGRSPSSASTIGNREYERHRALNIPNALIIPPATTATASGAPPYARAASTHAPVSHDDGSTPAARIATKGITYVSATKPTAVSTAMGYVRCGR